MNILKLVTITCTLLFFTSVSWAIQTLSGTGTVAETLDSGGYTYVRLEEDNRWVASKTFKVSIRNSVEFANATNMGEFHSRTLDRTFKNIMFTNDLQVIRSMEEGAHGNFPAIAEIMRSIVVLGMWKLVNMASTI